MSISRQVSSGEALGSVTLSNGVEEGFANFSTSFSSVGSHSITVVYSGDAAHSGSTSPVFTQTVQPAPTTTSLSSSVDPSAFDQSVTFTANVGSSYAGTPTGTVNFMDGATLLGTGTLTAAPMGAQAAFTTSALMVGTHSLTAVYSGDAVFAPSTSGALTQTVQPAPTTTSLSSSVDPSALGRPSPSRPKSTASSAVRRPEA